MAQNKRERPLCRAVCWSLALGLGGYLGYRLIVVMKLDPVQSGVIALVTMLLSGIILRGVFCRPRRVAPGRVEPTGGARGDRGPVRPRRKAATAAAVTGGAAAAAIRAEAQASGKEALPDVDGLAERFDDEIEHHLYAPLDELAAEGGSGTHKPVRYAADMVDDEEDEEEDAAGDDADVLRDEPDAFDDFDDAFLDEEEPAEPAPLNLTTEDAVEPAGSDVDGLAAEIHAAVLASAKRAEGRGAAAQPVAAEVAEVAQEPPAAVEAAPATEPENKEATEAAAPAEAAPEPAPEEVANESDVPEVAADPAPAVNGAVAEPDEDVDASDLTLIDGIDAEMAAKLGEIGITSLEQIAGMGPKNVRKIVGRVEGVEDRFTVRKWINGARALLDAEENG